jgi:protein O-mannosyl-transferase
MDGRDRYQAWAVCGFLLVAVGLVFGQTVGQGFVNLDDAKYVSQNPHLTHGLSAKEMAWLLANPVHHNWCPATWWSYLLDYQVCGLEPWGYHLTNVLLHAATAIGLFLVLRRMTGRFWPSALVAALFAVHPLRAESVAWITERKDVLGGLFFVLTLAAYLGYAGRRFSLGRYLLVLLLFALGLMAKPMLVTLPLVLLLLDYWPLGRIASGRVRETHRGESSSVCFTHPTGLLRVVVEKLPMFALMAASCVLTLWAQRELVVPYEHVGLFWRINNGLVSYADYLRQFFCPTGLALWYPLQVSSLSAGKILASAALLTLVMAGALVGARKCPYVLVGWLWFLGMLVPVIGVVQVTNQAMTDRFSYLPQIGIALAVVWGLDDLCGERLRNRRLCGVGAALVLAMLMGVAWRQVSFWRNSETLWRRTLACTSQNFMAHNMLGDALASLGRPQEAEAQYRQALAINPGYADAHYNLGISLVSLGRADEAAAQFRQALAIKQEHVKARVNLGEVLRRQGKLAEARDYLEQALKLAPDDAEARNNLGAVLFSEGRFDEAMAQFQQAVQIDPGDAQAHNNLGSALDSLGRSDEAIAQFQRALEIKPGDAQAGNNLQNVLSKTIERYREALRVKPDDVAAANNLAWLLATGPVASLRNGAEAIEIARRAEQLSGGREAAVLGTLAAAYAEAGRFPEAVETARKALDLARQQNHQGLAEGLRARIALYESGKPYRP